MSLLGLPQETQDQILMCLFGERVIHIMGSTNPECKDGVSFEICKRSKISIEKRFQKNLKDGIQYSEGSKYGRTICQPECRLAIRLAKTRMGQGWHPDPQYLAILFSCKQLHVAATLVLYSTNIFSFLHTSNLMRFISSLGQLQSAHLRSIDLSLIVISVEKEPWALSQILFHERDFAGGSFLYALGTLEGLQVLSFAFAYRWGYISEGRPIVGEFKVLRELRKLRELYVWFLPFGYHLGLGKPNAHHPELEQSLVDKVLGVVDVNGVDENICRG